MQELLPKNLKEMTLPELKELASHVRKRLIDVTSVNGGHLASNLGVVELTIAMHYVFSSPEDKMIFDVSHQSYVHKILTGRDNKLDTIRKYKGLCGFTHPDESEHDHFHAGHAGTALSLSLGVAHARDLQSENFHVIPIIGDATLTCGVTLEALNNIPKDLKNFIFVLNDNQMSISNNVGAITRILSRIINHPTANNIYEEIENALEKVPGVGKKLVKHGHNIRESIKNLVSTAPFFEQFNLSYVGPFDGHDLERCIEIMRKVKNTGRPVILHALTVKGKGFETAIDDPTKWHGCKPFDKSTCKFLPSSSNAPTFPKVFGQTLLEMADTDESIVAVTPAMTAGSCLTDFIKKYPTRCFDVGIAESHSVTFAGGIAYQNKQKVVMSIYGTFLQRAMDNLFHDVCLQKIPVVFAIDRGGLSAADGSTHHGIYDISFLSTMPNIIIVQPRDGHLLREILHSAFQYKQPTAIRYPNMQTTDSDLPLKRRMPGSGEILAKGEKVAIISLGHMNQTALQIREKLKKEGIDLTVVDPIFVKPLDEQLLLKIFDSHSLVYTLEEHSLEGGLGQRINSFVISHNLTNTRIINLGIPDRFVEHGTHSELMKELNLDADSITSRIAKEYCHMESALCH